MVWTPNLGQYDCIKAFSEIDLTKYLKEISVPVRVQNSVSELANLHQSTLPIEAPNG
jgi:hypothetical protein